MIKHRNDIDQLNVYVPGRPIDDVKREYSLDFVVKLASNENPYGFSEKAKNAVIESLANGALYPDGNCTLLREALSKKYNMPSNRFIFGCGADEIISMLGKTFVNKGDECITAEITFSQYAASVLSMGGKMVYAPMKNHGYDLEAIVGLITDKTRLIFITNPNNPTGTTHSASEQAAFMKKVPKDVIVVFDEAYAEYADGNEFPDTANMMNEYKNIILLKTFSKVYGLASFRVGYAIAEPEIVELTEKIRCPFNVPSAAQAAALAALGDTAFVTESTRKNRAVRDFMYAELDKMRLSYIPTQANFIMLDINKDSRTAFIDLMKLGYIIRPGSAFTMDTYLRVTLGTLEQMEGFAGALKKL